MGISFRATSGFVTDASGDTYSLGEAYPVTRGGYTFGFGTNRTGSARDRASTAERLAGIVFVANGGSTDYFRHDVPAPGTYTLRLALGDADNAQTQRAVVRDGVGGTVLATITGATVAAEWLDAAGTVRTPFTVWNSSNTSISVTLTGTALVVELGDTGGSNATTISYMDVVGAGDTTPPTITGPGGATGSTSSVSIPENTTAVHTFTANESVTWSLNGGADVARFSISAGGALAFLVAPNFETPTDADTNNTYIVGVRATDAAGNATTQTCTVTVTDVSDGGILTGSVTFDNLDTSGALGENPSTMTGTLTFDNVAPTGTLGIAPGSVSTNPFIRNTGSLPTGLSAVAVAVLSDDPNLQRLAGNTSLSQDSSGKITYTGSGLPAVGTSVLVVTRESDGKLGIERYTVQ